MFFLKFYVILAALEAALAVAAPIFVEDSSLNLEACRSKIKLPIVRVASPHGLD